jgi:hypothetical protein
MDAFSRVTLRSILHATCTPLCRVTQSRAVAAQLLHKSLAPRQILSKLGGALINCSGNYHEK